jgi:C4-dicarboxylate transporter DctQ subunit
MENVNSKNRSGFFRKLLDMDFEFILGAIIISLLMILLFFNVILRYVFNYAIAATEDLARIAFVWTTYLGAISAARYGIHFRVEAGVNLFPKDIRKYIWAFADFLWLIFCVFVVIFSWPTIADLLAYPMMSATLGINLVYFWFIIPISFTLMAIRLTIFRYRKLRYGDHLKEEEQIKGDTL